jgi:hypothetical protein
MAMPSTSVKATYSLDPETVRLLERMARRWNVTKSEALRKAIHLASAEGSEDRQEPLAAFERLQRSSALREPAVRQWLHDIAAERKAWSTRRDRRSK